MLKLLNTDSVTVKGKSKFPKYYELKVYKCTECGRTMRVESSYVPAYCHHCKAPSGLKKDKERG